MTSRAASTPMSSFLRDYLTVVWFGAAALCGVAAAVSLGIRRRAPQPD